MSLICRALASLVFLICVFSNLAHAGTEQDIAELKPEFVKALTPVDLYNLLTFLLVEDLTKYEPIEAKQGAYFVKKQIGANSFKLRRLHPKGGEDETRDLPSQGSRNQRTGAELRIAEQILAELITRQHDITLELLGALEILDFEKHVYQKPKSKEKSLVRTLKNRVKLEILQRQVTQGFTDPQAAQQAWLRYTEATDLLRSIRITSQADLLNLQVLFQSFSRMRRSILDQQKGIVFKSPIVTEGQVDEFLAMDTVYLNDKPYRRRIEMVRMLYELRDVFDKAIKILNRYSPPPELHLTRAEMLEVFYPHDFNFHDWFSTDVENLLRLANGKVTREELTPNGVPIECLELLGNNL